MIMIMVMWISAGFLVFCDSQIYLEKLCNFKGIFCKMLNKNMAAVGNLLRFRLIIIDGRLEGGMWNFICRYITDVPNISV